jgi:hypothetical protein
MDTQHRWPAILAGSVMAFVLGGGGVKAEDNANRVLMQRSKQHPIRSPRRQARAGDLAPQALAPWQS